MHIAIAGTIYNAVQKQWRWLNVQPVMWVGVVSYSLYLWQEPFLNRASVNWWNAFPANVILALLCASLSYYGVEKTFLQLRNREVNPLRLANDRRIALESAGANHKRQR
jgi:peptidoglycan/LPS O-acetylase OafA/YrhL